MPQKSRSRPGFLGSYDCRRIAARSMWRRSTCARMERTITDFLAKGRSSVTRLLTFGFLSLCRHCQVNTPASSVSPLVQTHDDFFDSPRNGFDIALLVAPGCEEMAKTVIMDLGKMFLIEPVVFAAVSSKKASE